MNLLDKYEATLKQKTLLEKYEEILKASPPVPGSSTLGGFTPKPYILNEAHFIEFTNNHRPHQHHALKAINGHDKKQISIPTGTGKTRLQIHLHVQDMIEKTKKNEIGVYAIGAHRLLLCEQLMDELMEMCINCGLPINVLYVGSARHDDKHIYDAYFNKGINSDTFESTYTTRGGEVLKFHEQTKESKRHLIIVSTYHSFHKMSCIDTINICTFDEAHTLTSKEFTKNIKEVADNIKRSYFFTATRKGMDDEEVFGGKTGASPLEMIEVGEIVEPKIHTMSLKDVSTGKIKRDDSAMLIQTVIEGFKEHKMRLKETSAYPDMIGAKLLVSCKGSDELNILQESEDFQKWCKESDINTFFFSSKYGSFEDFKKEERVHTYKSMKNLKDTDDCILIHIDILAEGINLPSITAVMLLRHLNKVKLLQTLGRGLRLLQSDRTKLYSGDMLPDEKEKFTKPYAYLMLPLHFEDLDADSEEMRKTLEEVVNTYKLPTEEFLPPEEFESYEIDYLDPVTDANKIAKLKDTYPLIHIIRDVIMKNYTETLPEDGQEKYNKLLKDLEEHKND